jgi:two-component system, NarL family, sensor histidine kinase UhpB
VPRSIRRGRTARRGGPRCELTLLGDPATPPDGAVSTAVFRILQESLINAVRHARARAVHVTLDLGAEAILLTVRDDGVGLGEPGAGGMGLLGMRERALALGGQLTIESAEGAGTTVRLPLPMAVGAAS